MDAKNARIDEQELTLSGILRANTALSARVEALEKALRELHAMVWGECPSLLNEDSGGNGMLDVEINRLLTPERKP